MDKISIDFGIMEKSSHILTTPCEFGWSDIGSWEGLAPHVPAIDGGSGRVAQSISVDSSGCVVFAPNKTVALLGVQNLVVVDTEDAILIMDRSRAQDLRHIVKILDNSGHTDLV